MIGMPRLIGPSIKGIDILIRIICSILVKIHANIKLTMIKFMLWVIIVCVCLYVIITCKNKTMIDMMAD